MQNVKIVIPARLSSTRLPQKLLRHVAGKSILRRTYEAASRSRRCSSIVVAVDDQRLLDEVLSFGGNAVMTSRQCRSGTDRIAEIAAADHAEIYVNVQGDEPEIDPNDIDQVIDLLEANPQAAAATLATPIRSPTQFNDPNCVKVVLDQQRLALYFSRSPIPYARDRDEETLLAQQPPVCWQHIGIYAYRRELLQWFTNQPQGVLEQIESLEQLRLLEHGNRIVVGTANSPSIGIDTEADLQAFESKIAGG